MTYPSVDIVTVNYNCGGYLPSYFEALRSLEYPASAWRVVMVDNASTDGSWERVHEWAAGVPLAQIALQTNGGVTAGNNAGIRAGESPYVALLNPDTRVRRDWLSVLVDRMECESDVGLVEARQEPTELSKYHHPSTGETSWASTGGVLVRRRALAHAGLFDERFFMYEDDVDLCWRLWLHGWRCVYEERAVYDHRPHDERPPTPFLRYHVVRNQAFMRFIYGSAALFLDRLWLGFKFALRDTQPELRKAALRAIRDAVTALPWLQARRASLPRTDCPWVGLFCPPYTPPSLVSAGRPGASSGGRCGR